MSSNQTHLNLTLHPHSLSLSLSHYVPRFAPLQAPKKIPSSSLLFQFQTQQYFSPKLCTWAFLVSLSLVRLSQRKTGNKPRTFSLSFTSQPFFLSSSLPPFPLSFSFSHFPSTHHTLFLFFSFCLFLFSCFSILALWVALFSPDPMMKMKGVLPMDPPYDPYQDQRTRMMRHQSLLQDYEDLQKETEAMRRKLQAIKQKKLMLSSEVRFLRQRYNYLLKHPLPKAQPKQQVSKPKKLKIQAPVISKQRNYNRKESNLRPQSASHSKERVSNGVEVSFPKTGHKFDLNKNARSSSKKDTSILPSLPSLDLNHKDRIHAGGNEASKKSIVPFFDLNQISREEEELQGNIEPVKIEDPKRITQRVTSDEQQNDIKLSACRNIGDGSSRAGKRKITWQDQVALRV